MNFFQTFGEYTRKAVDLIEEGYDELTKASDNFMKGFNHETDQTTKTTDNTTTPEQSEDGNSKPVKL